MSAATIEGMENVRRQLYDTNVIALEKTLMWVHSQIKFKDKARMCCSVAERLTSALKTVKPLVHDD